MTNFGVRGRVLDEEGQPLAGLVVDVLDHRFLGEPQPLAVVVTREDGTYHARYPPESYQGVLDSTADLLLVVHDRASIRELARAGPFVAVDEPLFHAPDLVVPRREAGGWLATDGRGRALPVHGGNRVEPLVDNEACFGAVLDLVRRAERSLHIQQLLFKPDTRVAFADASGAAAEGRRLVDALRDAAARGVQLRILLNENAVVPDDVDEIADELRDAGALPGLVDVRGFLLAPEVLHAKSVIRDGEEAILVGSPFEPRWWDTRAHLIEDERRGKGIPMHDVALRLRGPVVAAMGASFARLWNLRGDDLGEPPIPEPGPPPAVGAVAAQALATLPDGLFAERGETSIVQAYERALANAEEHAYVETQYFTSPRVARAMERALRANPRLEVILLVNDHMDVPLRHYDRILDRRLGEMGWPDHPRLAAFSAWSSRARDGGEGVIIRPIYVHSKVALVDDAWGTVGSANLDGYSLDSADEFGLVGTRCVEWNLALLDGIEGAPASGFVRALRQDLWSEALGLPRDELAKRPRDGWIALWRERAERNLRALGRGEPLDAGFVLPHRPAIPDGVRRHEADFNLFNQ